MTTDNELLTDVALAAERFRSAVIAGDTAWVYKRTIRPSRASQASRHLVELLAECHRRGILDQGDDTTPSSSDP